MKHPEAFRQVIQAAFERASFKHRQRENQPLSLRRVALETGIDVSVLSRLSRGITRPDSETLFHFLVYLGCDETERLWIFHLAELATPEETKQALVRMTKNPPIIQTTTTASSQSSRVLDRFELEVLSLQAPPDQTTPTKKQRSRENNSVTKKSTKSE